MPWHLVFVIVFFVLGGISSARAQLINEILFDPHPDVARGDANGDGFLGSDEDEFVEIVNQKHVTIDLSGCTLSDELMVRHVFPSGSVLAPECAVVVFGGGSPAGDFGGALVQVASTGGLGLSNWGDTVRLSREGELMAEYSYGPGVTDQSITRQPDFGPEPLVPHASLPGATGLQSPGTTLDGRPFPGCAALAAEPSLWGNVKQLYRRRIP